MIDDKVQTTLHDQLSEAFDKVEAEQPITQESKADNALPTETPEQKAERLRDEKGRFTEGKKEVKKEAKVTAPVTPHETKPVTETKPHPQRPSSWKKEMWPVWDKLTGGQQLTPEESLQLAEYNNQREQDYAKGVSTYKQEWENAKPLLDTMAQFKPILDQYNIKPTEWISNLGNAHKLLALGTPEQKLSMFVKLAQDYQVPLQAMFSQGQDGKVYFNPQIQTYQAQQPQQQDPRQIVKEMLMEEKVNQEVQTFSSNTEQYPYFEQVKETMAGLLQAGLAQDLKGAYEAAIRHPIHADIFDTLQQQQREKDEQTKREQAQKAVQSAKAKAVSPRSSTPVGTSTKSERKGLREQLESSFDEVVQGRV